MKIGIHKSKSGFHPRWVNYCEERNIPYKIVDCYANDIVKQLEDCNALMWHFHQNNPKDILFAKQLLYALQQKGMKVFPDFHTVWHFDDKVGQKYLLESIGAPMVPTYVFYDMKKALDWVEYTIFPKVFKLRGGAGSSNVKLVKSKKEAVNLIKKAFRKGFKQYDKLESLQERWRKYKNDMVPFYEVLKGIARFFKEPTFSKVKGLENGYILFQDFVPGNKFDIRVIIIGEKAFAIKRMVRENDFRASGSGYILYEKKHFDEKLIMLSFKINEKINSQCLTLDYIFDNNEPKIVEISYGFSPEGYDPCPGYWDKELIWHEGKFNPYGWMVDLILSNIGDKYGKY